MDRNNNKKSEILKKLNIKINNFYYYNFRKKI